MSANDDIADALISRAIALSRYGAGASKDVLAILAKAQKDIIRRLPDITSESNYRKQIARINEIQKLIAETYDSVSATHADEMQQLSSVEATWFVKTTNTIIGATAVKAMPTIEQLNAIANNVLVVGNPSKEWWDQQSRAAQNEFKRVVRLGLSQSETNQQITKRVTDAINISRREADALVRTATQSVAIAARDAVAAANDEMFEGKMSLAVLDSRTTFLCASYDHEKYTLDFKPLGPKKLPYKSCPRHFRCRSLFTYILKAWDKIGLKKNDITEGMRSSIDGQVPASTDFTKFISTKSAAWQKQYLGEGRYDLYKSGKITISDLIDGSGRELNLKQLRKFE